VYTNKEVAELTGLGKNTVKDIDKERLQELYTTTDGKLIKPEKPAKFRVLMNSSCIMDTAMQHTSLTWRQVISYGSPVARRSRSFMTLSSMFKTLRRQGYEYPDDEYFFLKLFDMSRRSYERNPKSHKICD
ncbi:MAG: hypothetical protein MSA26_18545, partial [Lachnospiraceae bacterium]|nr:hypothetical protein [Lachnospiraceae bacterium]